jgi:hypothetical protein
VTTASVMESGSIPTGNLTSIWVGNRYEVWGFRKETVEYFLQVVEADWSCRKVQVVALIAWDSMVNQTKKTQSQYKLSQQHNTKRSKDKGGSIYKYNSLASHTREL